jgi:Protein of unknown function (DUF1648).
MEVLCLVALASLFGLMLYYYNDLPKLIPKHFNSIGEPTRFGPKSGILILPVAVFVIYLLMTILSRFPHLFNYAVEITPDNAEVQYKNAIAMIQTIKLTIIGVNFYITYFEIKISLGESTGLGSYFLPVMLTILFGVLAIFIYRSFQSR